MTIGSSNNNTKGVESSSFVTYALDESVDNRINITYEGYDGVIYNDDDGDDDDDDDCCNLDLHQQTKTTATAKGRFKK